MEVAGPIFNVREYAFVDTPAESTYQSKRKIELLKRYKETKEISSEETLNLYSKVRNIYNQDVSLVSVRDYAQNTLNLALETKNRVAEMKMNLEDIPIPDMIHLHKQVGDILFTDLLKATLGLSKLHTLKRKIENQLR